MCISSIVFHLSIFCHPGKEKKVLDKEMSTGSWFKYLPPSVMNFQPILRTLAQPIQREQLRDTLQQWIDTYVLILTTLCDKQTTFSFNKFHIFL